MRGFYSPIDQLAAQLPRTKGTGAEFMTELSKRPGYKPQEVQDRDLQTLMALPKMERAQFLQALKAKPAPKLEETTLDERSEDPTKYEEYTLPGGSNYREILLQMPHDFNRRVDPASGHWDQPNVLAHVRAKDRLIPDLEGPHNVKVIEGNRFTNVKHKTREDAERFANIKHQGGYRTEITPLNNKKILHIEEIQSDWHQQGRDKGYLPPDITKQWQAAKLAHRRLKEQLEEAKANSEHAERGLNSNKPLYQDPEVRKRLEAAKIEHNNKIMDLMPQVMKAEAEHQNLEQKAKTGVPDAPFKKNWHELALKKMIHHAAEKGYDAIAITPGQEQADRYKLSKHIGMVAYHPEEQRFQAFKPNRETVINEKGATPERVAELIGKEAAERLMKAPKAGDHHYLEGENLNIGGEGMKGFYDKMVPSFLNQFGKKYGAQVGTMPLGFNKWELEGQMPKLAEKQATLHYFPITPQMREDVTKNGVPLYAEGGVAHMDNGGSIKELENYIRERKGEYGAKRVQRAADEIPNLERMYTLRALRDAFGGDNAKALMTMNPADFEKFAVRLFSDPDTREEDMAEKIERDRNLPPMSHHDYIKYLANIKGGFADVPFLEINKRPEYLPNIIGHEGRHRSRALASMNVPKSLVRLLPSRFIREDMPRRYQEDFIEAMKKELGEKRLVTGEGRSLLPANLEAPEHKSLERKNMLGGRPQLPDIYAEGGSIKPIGYTKEKVTVSPNLDAMRYELMSVKHFAKKVK